MKEKLIDFFITIIVVLILSIGIGVITVMGVCFFGYGRIFFERIYTYDFSTSSFC